jgi:DNA uptake protein ComE-like DNA-binding protein
MSEAEKGLYKTLQLDRERNRYTSVEDGGQVSGISQGTGTID